MALHHLYNHSLTNIGIKILTISFDLQTRKIFLMGIQMLRGFSEKVAMIQEKIWL